MALVAGSVLEPANSPQRSAEIWMLITWHDRNCNALAYALLVGCSVISPRRNRKGVREYEKNLHKAHPLTGDFFARLKQGRVIATRCDKRAKNLLGAIYWAALAIWLN